MGYLHQGEDFFNPQDLCFDARRPVELCSHRSVIPIEMKCWLLKSRSDETNVEARPPLDLRGQNSRDDGLGTG